MGHTPFKQLLIWAADESGDVSKEAWHRQGIGLGCPPPAQNGAFGTRRPSMVRVGNRRALTDAGRERVARYRCA